MSSETFLSSQFRDYYREVVRWKQRVLREPADPTVEETNAKTVRESLLGLLERQAIAVQRGGGELAAESYREAQYLMAALADEVFRHLVWSGRKDWEGANLLEQRLFGSHNAGEEVFQRLERILRSRDPLKVELAKVYLLALGLGFQGRFRGPADPPEIRSLRSHLFNFITNKDPDAPPEAKPLFPEAYASTLDVGEGSRLAYLRHWVVALLLLVALWLVAADRIWHGLTDRMQEVAEKFLLEEKPSTR